MDGIRLLACSHSIPTELGGTSEIAGAAEGKLEGGHHSKLVRLCKALK
jgi:hypothetical protein